MQLGLQRPLDTTARREGFEQRQRQRGDVDHEIAGRLIDRAADADPPAAHAQRGGLNRYARAHHRHVRRRAERDRNPPIARIETLQGDADLVGIGLDPGGEIGVGRCARDLEPDVECAPVALHGGVHLADIGDTAQAIGLHGRIGGGRAERIVHRGIEPKRADPCRPRAQPVATQRHRHLAGRIVQSVAMSRASAPARSVPINGARSAR